MFCSYCGKKVEIPGKFCMGCGKTLHEPPTEEIRRMAKEYAERWKSKQLDEKKTMSPAAPASKTQPQNGAARGNSTGTGRPMQQMQTANQQTGNAVPMQNLNVSDFWSHTDFLIDEKVSLFKFENAYKLFDENGNQIGNVRQDAVSAGGKAARLVLGSGVKSLQKFSLGIYDMADRRLITIEKQGGLNSAWQPVMIKDEKGADIGNVRFVVGKGLRSEIEIHESSGFLIARIEGNFLGYSFEIHSNDGEVVGKIDKNWNGIAKELFTTADKYHVSISQRVSGLHRVIICASALTLDMIRHE